jgi:NADPH:quinone reductase-like Zn-dependent oxidoreductase
MSIQQYQTTEKGGTLRLVTAAKPTPGPKEIAIRPKTVSVNPIDWKNMQFGAMVKSWPAVLGIEGAGTVESVGAGVTAFKVGDEVMGYADGNRGKGSFQEVYVVPENYVAKKPQGLSFAQASSIP